MSLLATLFFILFVFLFHLFTNGLCISDVQIGYKITLPVPMEYISGFTGRAFIMDTDQMEPKFRVGLSVESVEQKYSCSLDVFLGDLKVWSSGHFSRFYTTEICVLELTQNGDLQLKGQNELVGWKTGTSAQGVQVITILENHTENHATDWCLYNSKPNEENFKNVTATH